MATSVISSGRPEDDASTTKAEQISKAMKAYLERARAHGLYFVVDNMVCLTCRNR